MSPQGYFGPSQMDPRAVKPKRRLIVTIAGALIIVLLYAVAAHAISPEEEAVEEPEIEAVCPPEEGKRAECMSLEIEPGGEEAEVALEGTGERGGLSPADLISAYSLNTSAGSGATIAIV